MDAERRVSSVSGAARSWPANPAAWKRLWDRLLSEPRASEEPREESGRAEPSRPAGNQD